MTQSQSFGLQINTRRQVYIQTIVLSYNIKTISKEKKKQRKCYQALPFISQDTSSFSHYHH